MDTLEEGQPMHQEMCLGQMLEGTMHQLMNPTVKKTMKQIQYVILEK